MEEYVEGVGAGGEGLANTKKKEQEGKKKHVTGVGAVRGVRAGYGSRI